MKDYRKLTLFTDADFVRLDRELQKTPEGFAIQTFGLFRTELEGILGRMEAAEDALDQLINFYDGKDPLVLGLIKRWRERAGK